MDNDFLPRAMPDQKLCNLTLSFRWTVNLTLISTYFFPVFRWATFVAPQTTRQRSTAPRRASGENESEIFGGIFSIVVVHTMTIIRMADRVAKAANSLLFFRKSSEFVVCR